MKKLNLALAEYHYEAATNPNNNPYEPKRRWNVIPYDSYKVVDLCKFHDTSTVEELKSKIDLEKEARSKLPLFGCEKTKKAHALERYVEEHLFGKTTLCTEYVSEIEKIHPFHELRKKFQEEILIDRWTWNYFEFFFDIQSRTVKIRTSSNIDGGVTVEYDVYVFVTEMEMTDKILDFYLELLEDRSKRAAEVHYNKRKEQERKKEIEELGARSIDYIMKGLNDEQV